MCKLTDETINNVKNGMIATEQIDIELEGMS